MDLLNKLNKNKDTKQTIENEIINAIVKYMFEDVGQDTYTEEDKCGVIMYILEIIVLIKLSSSVDNPHIQDDQNQVKEIVSQWQELGYNLNNTSMFKTESYNNSQEAKDTLETIAIVLDYIKSLGV